VWCKRCRAAAYSVYAQENLKKLAAKARTWRKDNPDAVFAIQKRWRERHPEKAAENKQRWFDENREYWLASHRANQTRRRAEFPELVRKQEQEQRAKRLAAPGCHVADDIRRTYRLQKGKCAYCRASLAQGYYVDHILALSRGGTNDARNLQLLCADCNLRKSSTDPLVFARKIGRLL
jgi:5-methylcytosine-specific restriction endonuclease McrA